jgi:alpha-glucosidase
MNFIGLRGTSKVDTAEQGITVDCGEKQIQIKFCTPGIVNVKMLPHEEYGAVEGMIVDRTEWEKTEVTIKNGTTSNQLIYESDKVRVTVDLETLLLSFYDAQGQLLLSSDDRHSIEVESGGGTRKRVLFKTSKQESFYGLGDGGHGFEKTGTSHLMWTRHNLHIGSEIPSPLVLSTKGYALFFHNPYEARIDIETNGLLKYMAEDGNIDFYFIYGPSMDDLIKNYYEITGYPPMIPKWTFGYQQSTRHFINSQEVLDLARTLREREIPCDHITFLSTYSHIHGREQGWDEPIATYEWNKFLFPNPKEMIKEIKDMNFTLMCHQYPQISRGVEDYQEFIDKGYYVKGNDGQPLEFWADSLEMGTVFIDFTHPDARQWWWEKLKKCVYEMGIDSWWNDGGEGPKEGELYEGSYKKCHNVFDLFRHKTVFDNYRKDYPGLDELDPAEELWGGELLEEMLVKYEQDPNDPALEDLAAAAAERIALGHFFHGLTRADDQVVATWLDESSLSLDGITAPKVVLAGWFVFVYDLGITYEIMGRTGPFETGGQMVCCPRRG